MFSKADLDYLEKSGSYFDAETANSYIVVVRSRLTGHEWSIHAYPDTRRCYVFHSHARGGPYRKQWGNFRSLRAALDRILEFEDKYYKKLAGF